jgi:hypothetical protein
MSTLYRDHNLSTFLLQVRSSSSCAYDQIYSPSSGAATCFAMRNITVQSRFKGSDGVAYTLTGGWGLFMFL